MTSDRLINRPKTATAEPELGGLNATRLIIVLVIGFGYASTMPVGPHATEWFNHFGHDPSWFGLNVFFALSGWMGARSLTQGRGGWRYLWTRYKRALPALAIYTLIIVAVLYPILCIPEMRNMETVWRLLTYMGMTVSLVDPGGVMPGALDNAAYMCLLQGTVWTLRIGAVLHIGLMMLFLIQCRGRKSLTILAILATLAHGAFVALQLNHDLGPTSILGAPLQLAYGFMIGAALYVWKDRLPQSGKGWAQIAAGFFMLTGLQYLLPWTPALEITATCAWIASSFALLFASKALRLLRDWPNIVLPTYLGLWPITQIILYSFPAIPTLLLIACALILSVAAAWLFYRLMSPFIKQTLIQRRVKAT